MKASEIQQRRDDGEAYQVKMVRNEKVQGTWKDIVQGEVKNNSGTTNGVTEIVLVRRDGRPGRALADTVDDHEMKISHAIRNEDEMVNTRL